MPQAVLERSERVAPRPSVDEPLVPDAAAVAAVPAPLPSRPLHRRPLVLVIVIGLAIVGVIAGVQFWIHGQHYESTDDATLEGHVIPISARCRHVLAVHVQDNQLVKQGDVLVDLDPTDYQVAIDQAKGSLAAMQGKLAEAEAQVPAAQAERDEAKAALDAAQTNFENADRDLKRFQSLDDDGLQAAIGYVEHRFRNPTGPPSNKPGKTRAESQITTAQAVVIATRGDVEKANADLRAHQVNLGYCQIKASEDGRVTRKDVEPGAYVTSGEALLAMVPPEVWVVANFKETQLTYMHPVNRSQFMLTRIRTTSSPGTWTASSQEPAPLQHAPGRKRHGKFREDRAACPEQSCLRSGSI